MKGGKPVVKKVFYQQNDGRLSSTPPKHLGTVAKVCWRKIVPFLESTERVKRIDTGYLYTSVFHRCNSWVLTITNKIFTYYRTTSVLK